MEVASALRYPGGKQVLASYLSRLIAKNKLEGGIYAEPYAGGCGAALSLLFSGHVQRLYLNDADFHIFAFWHSVLFDTDAFLAKMLGIEISIPEWRRQRHIYKEPKQYSLLDVGFATFFLNRTNRSGIIKNGGPVGGLEQRGNWKLNARFNKSTLRSRIEKIARYSNSIHFYNKDAVDFMVELRALPGLFTYFDPPYYVKGRELYLNHYGEKDHKSLAHAIKGFHSDWVLSYDRVEPITSLYREYRQLEISLVYSAAHRKQGKEVLIFSKGLNTKVEGFSS